VSVKGETRIERFASSRELWSWIDAREKELGVGRPYLDRDPPHVGPIDGKEYADKRGRARARVAGLARAKLAGMAKAKLAGLATSTRQAVAASDNPGTMKRAAR